MSRSYKKCPGWSGRSSTGKLDKRFAAKAIRRILDKISFCRLMD